MNLERLIRRTRHVQSIPAPTFAEGARAAWFLQELIQVGIISTEQDPVGNVYARIEGGEAPPVVISAHLDTVFPMETPLRSRRTADQLIGPGIGDNAVGLAALLELAEDLSDSPAPGDVWLVANVGEEGLGNLIGMRQVVKRFGEQVSAYVVIEGMALGHIYHCGLPVQRFRISAAGSGGHSWIHAGRGSAIHALVQIAHALLELPLSKSPQTTLNIGVIAGGSSVNSIASDARLQIDLRSENQGNLDDIVEGVNRIVQEFESDEVTLSVEPIGERPGGGLPEDHPLVQAACRALEKAGESRCQLDQGSTDASVPLSQGMPAVCVGLTRGGGAHSMDEYIEITPISLGYQALLSLIYEAFNIIP
jgi:acetylornithine deacetylase/succinyl-diaminopimelate desuccinylase-like protein